MNSKRHLWFFLAVLAALSLIGLRSQFPDSASAPAANLSTNRPTPMEISRANANDISGRQGTIARGSVENTQRSRSELTAQLIAPLYANNANVQQTVAEEISNEFSSYLAEFSSARQSSIRDLLVEAYTDIQLVALAAETGTLSDSDLDNLSNPNYVLDTMQALLSAQELTHLENYLETRARNRFDLANASAVDALASELSRENREALLDTLFTQNYLILSPDGIGAKANLGLRADMQLRAISETRKSLQATLSEEQFAMAENFLAAQETAIAGMGIIFDPGSL